MTQQGVPVDTGWNLAWTVLLSVGVYGFIYVRRWRDVRRRHGSHGAEIRHLALWLGGLALLLVALVSPLDVLSDQFASAHMVQHLILADLAPIALILGCTKVLLRPLIRAIHGLERRLGVLAHPVFGVVAYVGAMWVWHVPALYDAALKYSAIHVLEHLTFAAAGALYWWHLLSPIRSRLRLGGMAPIAYMVSTKLAVGALGVLLTFLPSLLYSAYDRDGERWGLSALNDQQVAGAIMGFEQSIVMGIGLFWLFTRMLLESEREQQRTERLEAKADASAS